MFAPKAYEVNVSYVELSPTKIDSTIMIQVTSVSPNTASLVGSLSRPAKTPLVTTVAKLAIFVNIAGTASFMKQLNI